MVKCTYIWELNVPINKIVETYIDSIFRYAVLSVVDENMECPKQAMASHVLTILLSKIINWLNKKN